MIIKGGYDLQGHLKVKYALNEPSFFIIERKREENFTFEYDLEG